MGTRPYDKIMTKTMAVQGDSGTQPLICLGLFQAGKPHLMLYIIKSKNGYRVSNQFKNLCISREIQLKCDNTFISFHS